MTLRHAALVRKVLTAFAVFATSIVLAVAAVLPKAIASPSTIASPALAGNGLTVPLVHSLKQSLRGYYLAEFTAEVGSGLPFSSLCLKFTTSGTWSSTNNGGLNGTYLISGQELFASAIGYWSPPVYMSLQGSVNAKQGSGEYIVSQSTGAIFSGGTFTMTRSGCS
jgi:hypothetical protein